MRYVYGMTAALLLAGAAATLTLNPAGAQIAQNEPGTISAAAPRAGAPMSFADLAARLQPAVVNISTRQTIAVNRNQGFPPGFEEFFRQFGMRPPGGGGGNGSGEGGDDVIRRRGGSLGSGFIISPDGYVVTNNHVIAPAGENATVDTITVTLADRREFQAKVIGRDTTSDLAVLKIEANNLPFVRFGDSTRVRVGDWVIAVGNPFNIGATVTAGIISALHRGITGGGAYDRYIQTDASINMGNSGGPMFDLSGNVIGINTALISPTGGNVGIGFAIPAEQARPVIDALRRGVRPQRGYLGVSFQEIDDDNMAEALGVPKNSGGLIRAVTPGGPADRAGLQQGDVITKINGRPVNEDDRMAYLVANLQPGSRIPMEIVRNGQRRNLTVAIGERPTEEELAKLSGVEDPRPVRPPAESQQSPGQRSTRQSLGLTVQALTPELARSMNITDTNTRGVVVSSVDPSSDAADKGFQPRDIILSINQRPTRTPEEVASAVEAARSAGRGSVLLLRKRGTNPPDYVAVGISKG